LGWVRLSALCVAPVALRSAVAKSNASFLQSEAGSASEKKITGKNGFVTATKLGTANKIFVAANKNFAAATKRFVYRTKHFVVVTKHFCYPYFNK